MIRFKHFKPDEDLNLFCGLSAALSEEFWLGIEYDDILHHEDPDRVGLNRDNYDSGYGSANVMVGYAWDVGLRLELDFKRLFRGVDKHYRVLKILYTF